MTETQEVWRLAHPSQECELGPEATLTEATLTVRYDFENASGTYEWTSFQFQGVSAFEFLREELCRPDQFKALDKLLEVGDSPWLRELRESRVPSAGDARHYRIYFDEYGCYEVLASAFLPGN